MGMGPLFVLGLLGSFSLHVTVAGSVFLLFERRIYGHLRCLGHITLTSQAILLLE
jgi:hypothetical protein